MGPEAFEESFCCSYLLWMLSRIRALRLRPDPNTEYHTKRLLAQDWANKKSVAMRFASVSPTVRRKPACGHECKRNENRLDRLCVGFAPENILYGSRAVVNAIFPERGFFAGTQHPPLHRFPSHIGRKAGNGFPFRNRHR